MDTFSQPFASVSQKPLVAIPREEDRRQVLSDLEDVFNSGESNFLALVASLHYKALNLSYEQMRCATRALWQRISVKKCSYVCAHSAQFLKVQEANVQIANTLPGESIRLKGGKVTANSLVCPKHSQKIQAAAKAPKAMKPFVSKGDPDESPVQVKEEDTTALDKPQSHGLSYCLSKGSVDAPARAHSLPPQGLSQCPYKGLFPALARARSLPPHGLSHCPPSRSPRPSPNLRPSPSRSRSRSPNPSPNSNPSSNPGLPTSAAQAATSARAPTSTPAPAPGPPLAQRLAPAAAQAAPAIASQSCGHQCCCQEETS